MSKFILELVKGNRDFANEDVLSTKMGELLCDEQQPRALILTCSDFRVAPEVIFKQSLGSMFIMRNVGAKVTEDVLQDVHFFIDRFNTIEVLILLGHSQCEYYKHNLQKGIEINPVLVECLRTKLKEQEIIDKIAQMKVEEGIKKLSEIIPSKIELCGAFYNSKTGKVKL